MTTGKLYVGQPIEIKLPITVDGQKMTTAASAVITVLKPNKSQVTWTAIVDNVAGEVSYSATAEEIDVAGRWTIQPVITFAGVPSKTIPGTSVFMEVAKRFT